jgi:4'-phosphopantetheinyl transferase
VTKLVPHDLKSEPDLTGLGESVAIWTLLDSEPLPEWANGDCLSENELARHARTSHAGAKERFRRGRVLLRNILGRTLGVKPRGVAITLGEYGKPRLSAGDLQFNLSHTEGVLILALSKRVIGIDVERPSAERDIDGLVERYFSEIEIEQYDEIPTELQPLAFMRGWTCKEALLKALGTGVRDLQNVSVDLDPRLPPEVLECPGPNRWELTTWNVGAASVALCSAR